MIQKQKELLTKDLCGRLPYGVICDRLGKPKKLLSISPYKVFCCEFDNGEYMPSEYGLDNFKPYLRPMESMTEEEEKEFQEIKMSYHFDEDGYILFDWLNKKGFDYRGLIPMGIALEAPQNMYK